MKFPIPQAVEDGVILMENGGVCDLSYPNSKNRRGRVQGGGFISPTITCENGLVQVKIYEIPNVKA